MGQLRRLNTYEQSRFWVRLQQYSNDKDYPWDKTALAHLIACVREVAEQSDYISSLTVRYMPHYTLHEARHFLNVLAIMDALVPDEVMEGLTPLECALCIMTAFTHDLGMALQDEEHASILSDDNNSPERQRYLTYRDGFGEELRQIERWKIIGGTDAENRIKVIEGYILSSFIRDTHTDEKMARIERWLDAIARETKKESLYRYGSYDFKRALAIIGLSHGKGVRWLRSQLSSDRNERGFYLMVGTGERANLAFPGLLLRLADIMDFDASRAPRILFKHIGIDNDKSILEWNKHLSISGWGLEVEGERPQLEYAADCIHPVYEKSIREFARWIEQELIDVRGELDLQRRLSQERYDLYIPGEVKLDIRSQGYIYQDIEFRLDQDEIMQLLLGESLWGNPDLCIRELLQNALDAVQMRDLRLKIIEEGVENIAEPVDTLKRDEKLHVELTWGRDEASNQEFICITDNGIGMTQEVIIKYFTQIGKSYYRSPDFKREKITMEAHGLFATPISSFGIGILSCFMIADRLEVRTRSGSKNNGIYSHNITVSGPGSLFWLKPGTLDHQGTEIKLFLKDNYRIQHDNSLFTQKLKNYEYNIKQGTNSIFDNFSNNNEHKHVNRILDPALIAAVHVIWPLYPIYMQAPNKERITIDDQYRSDVLFKIKQSELNNKALEWKCPLTILGNPNWGYWDWIDNKDEGATGSRIRLWFPLNDNSKQGPKLPEDKTDQNLCYQDELAAFVEPQLNARRRTEYMTKGMFVKEISFMRQYEFKKPIPNIGGFIWIDLRGDASPMLTADRQTALEPPNADEWFKNVEAIFIRMKEDLELLCRPTNGILKNLKTSFYWEEGLFPKIIDNNSVINYDFLKSCSPSWERSNPTVHSLQWSYLRLFQEGNIRDKHLSLSRNKLDRGKDLRYSLASEYQRARTRHYEIVFSSSIFWAHDDFYFARERPRQYRNIIPDHHIFKECFFASILQEAFWPDLPNSLPIFDLQHLKGFIGDASLTGPGLVHLSLANNDDTSVLYDDLAGVDSEIIIEYQYDLIFPMTAIPIGHLRQGCPKWRRNRLYRQMGVMPFLYPGLDEHIKKYSIGYYNKYKVKYIYSLLPDLRLWSLPFSQWSQKDWTSNVISALWDVEGGRILWAIGAQRIEDMIKNGHPYKEIFNIN